MKENRKQDLEWAKQEYEQKRMSPEQVTELKETIEKAKHDKKKSRRGYKAIGAVAAAVAVFVLLPNTSSKIAYAMSNIPVVGKLVDVVTFRDYQYESERHNADVTVQEIVIATEQTEDIQVQEKLEKSAEEINAEIQEITEQIVGEFEENLQYEEGYQDVLVKTEVINTTEDYFTLKLLCYQGAGSGAEWDYFYTIDLKSGERLLLKDLFVDGADYITPISDNIKTQMREQMAADENVCYWIDYDEVPDWNFESITDETSFYINENGEIVISFNEGDVAPMYMGVVEFIIPQEITADIRK